MFYRLLLLFSIMILSNCNIHSKTLSQQTLSIFSSSNLMGYIKPCGWGTTRAGGLARRATYIKDHFSEQNYTLILDSGDFIGGRNEWDKLKAQYLLRGLSDLNYDAINLGERDFMLGSQFLLEMKEKYNISEIDNIQPILEIVRNNEFSHLPSLQSKLY